MIDVILVYLLLIWKYFTPFSIASIVNFEQVKAFCEWMHYGEFP